MGKVNVLSAISEVKPVPNGGIERNESAQVTENGITLRKRHWIIMLLFFFIAIFFTAVSISVVHFMYELWFAPVFTIVICLFGFTIAAFCVITIVSILQRKKHTIRVASITMALLVPYNILFDVPCVNNNKSR